MRRDLASEFPLLSHLYGIKPDDVDRLTLREITWYRRARDQYLADQEG